MLLDEFRLAGHKQSSFVGVCAMCFLRLCVLNFCPHQRVCLLRCRSGSLCFYCYICHCLLCFQVLLDDLRLAGHKRSSFVGVRALCFFRLCVLSFCSHQRVCLLRCRSGSLCFIVCNSLKFGNLLPAQLVPSQPPPLPPPPPLLPEPVACGSCQAAATNEPHRNPDIQEEIV